MATACSFSLRRGPATFLLTSGLPPPLVGCPSCGPSATGNAVPVCPVHIIKKSEANRINVTIYLLAKAEAFMWDEGYKQLVLGITSCHTVYELVTLVLASSNYWVYEQRKKRERNTVPLEGTKLLPVGCRLR